ncbi:MAG TPA: DUF4231 domain-containing protein [Kofleriaceae bacterium]|nr:DUF4231 domain-containing protein [Kofleriaceae bacterium]
MARDSPAAVLGDEIKARLDEFSRKRSRDKRKAFWLKMGAALLGAAITVLLGLKVSEAYETTFKNIALVSGALVGLLNAWDAFYDHRALWVKRTTTVARLKTLDRRLRIARATNEELDEKTLEAFRAALDQVLDDDLSSWVQMRRDTSEKAGSVAQPKTEGA